MKRFSYLLASLVACFVAYQFGLNRHVVCEDCNGEAAVFDRDEFAVAPGEGSNSSSHEYSLGNENGEAYRIAQLEVELSELRKAYDRVREQRDFAVRPRSGLRQIGFDKGNSRLPRITNETYEYLQLDEKDAAQLKRVGERIVQNLVAWELENMTNVKSGDESVQVEMPAMPEADADRYLNFREPLRALVSDEDFKMLESSMHESLSHVFQRRRITLSLRESNDNRYYFIQEQLLDEEGKPRGGRGSGGGGIVRERFRHIFGEDPLSLNVEE